jgi:hypothetical protein
VVELPYLDEKKFLIFREAPLIALYNKGGLWTIREDPLLSKLNQNIFQCFEFFFNYFRITNRK